MSNLEMTKFFASLDTPLFPHCTAPTRQKEHTKNIGQMYIPHKVGEKRFMNFMAIYFEKRRHSIKKLSTEYIRKHEADSLLTAAAAAQKQSGSS